MANTYDAGETVVLQATFKNSGGTLSTPDTQALYIERPNGTTDSVAGTLISNPSTGVLQYSDTASGYGTTWYRFVGATGAVTVEEQGWYKVRKQHAVPAVDLLAAQQPLLFRIQLTSPDGVVAHTVEAASDNHAARVAEELASRIAETQMVGGDDVSRTLARQQVSIDSVERV